MKIPQYITIEAVSVSKSGSMDSKVLPAGTFVKPIKYDYLPKHIQEEVPMWFDHSKTVYCYCSMGIVPLPWDKLREV